VAKWIATAPGQVHLSLGEGPGVSPVTGDVSVVDILGREIHLFRQSPTGLDHYRTITTPTMVGAAIPLDSGELLTAEADGIFRISPDGTRVQVCGLPVADPDFRCNDAKIGPDGRLWVGVMHVDAKPEEGSLWAIDPRGNSQCLLQGLTIPNGMDWWDDEFWFVNGPTEEVRCYRLESERLVDTGKAVSTPGTPDGFTMDVDGNIWLAVWGGGKVVCLSQDGDLLHTVSVPSPHTTSACFVGDRLVITSATVGLDNEAVIAYPDAGDVFLADVATTGHTVYTRFG
jgi:sugar lactone lactonase YvrE